MVAVDKAGMILLVQYVVSKIHRDIELVMNKDLFFSIISIIRWYARIIFEDAHTCYNYEAN